MFLQVPCRCARMPHRALEENKQQPIRVKSGHQPSCCSNLPYFMCDMVHTSSHAHLVYLFSEICCTTTQVGSHQWRGQALFNEYFPVPQFWKLLAKDRHTLRCTNYPFILKTRQPICLAQSENGFKEEKRSWIYPLLSSRSSLFAFACWVAVPLSPKMANSHFVHWWLRSNELHSNRYGDMGGFGIQHAAWNVSLK